STISKPSVAAVNGNSNLKRKAPSSSDESEDEKPAHKNVSLNGSMQKENQMNKSQNNGNEKRTT
ncbi:unnamed protein product, partial [Rotaria socialis]